VSGPPPPDDTSAGSPAPEEGAKERRTRLARVFGEVLPEGTSDDRGDTWGERDVDNDEWLRRQVPPHHG
jgi:hypothetical protein